MVSILDASNGLALRCGAYHYFDRTSFKQAMLGACSATSFLSLAFSVSSCLSRRASLTSRPPYLFRQL